MKEDASVSSFLFLAKGPALQNRNITVQYPFKKLILKGTWALGFPGAVWLNYRC